MQLKTFSLAGISIRSAGRAAIASGLIGFLALGCLISYLVVRDQDFQTAMFFSRFHDAGLTFQFLLLVPVAFGLYNLSRERHSGMSRTTLAMGVGAALFTVLFILLSFAKVLVDVLYMFPQGVFGVWLIIVCWGMSGILSKGLRWFGMIVGLGLSIIGTSLVGYAIFVSTIILQIPAATEEAIAQVPQNTPNLIVHQMLFIGSFMGVLTLPIWTVLLGFRMLREPSSISNRVVPIPA
jgi:hypothetical protein